MVLQRSLVALNYDLQHYFVHQYLIRKVVIKTYAEDKRSAIPMNENCLFDRINKYINRTQNYFFILNSEQVKRLKIEIDNLIYLEIIHQIPSSSLPINVMDRFKGFYIDSGKYLHTLNSRGLSIENNKIYDFNYILPDSISQEIDQYIINLDDVDNEFVECPNCGKQISKNHPVYVKAKICTSCACSFR